MARNNESELDGDQVEVDSIYEEFWKPLVEKDGTLDIEKVKRELCDFFHIMDFAPKVYMHVTGGRISKPLTNPEAIIGEADAHIERLIEEAIEEYKAENPR